MRRTTRLVRRLAALGALAALVTAAAVVVPTSGPPPHATADAQVALPFISVMGPSQLSAVELASYYKSVNHLPYRAQGVSIDDLAALFVNEGARYNVRGDVAFAQSLVETAWFNYPDYGQVRPWNYNYARIAACHSCNAP